MTVHKIISSENLSNMNAKICALLLVFVGIVYCRDFYMGMFKKNDYLVAQDYLYKERTPYRRTLAKYLKLVHCPITYIRVVDRLGVGVGPVIRLIRGGLLKKHIYLYMTSPYNQPISVTIYIGCPNTEKKTIEEPAAREEKTTPLVSETTSAKDETKPEVLEATSETGVSTPELELSTLETAQNQTS